MEARATLKAYLDLCRVSNLPTVWTNVLAASLLAGGGILERGPAALAAVALSLFYLGGMALNDLCDCDHDRLQRPSRPIPSGRIPVTDARLFTLTLFAAAFLVLALAPWPAALPAALLLLAVIYAYDRHHKQNPYSVLLMASCRFLVYVVAALAVSGRVAAPVLLAGAIQFGYIVLLSLVARWENVRSEKPPQVHSPGGSSAAALAKPEGGLGRGASPFPLIPLLLAGISLLDGVLLAFLVQPQWLAAGVAGFLLTLAGQRYVRGD
jgi:4-hydroxybenzoate polyprenyltransferase